MITSVSVGELFPDAPHIGHHLPLGSVLAQGMSTRHDRYTQAAPRTWVSQGNGLIDPYVLISPLYLCNVGGSTTDVVTLPSESASAFLWRLRDTALAAAERSGINKGPVIELCESFGAHEPLFTAGGVVANEVDIKKLPHGTVVYAGHPDSPDHMDVWDVTDDGLAHVFGPNVHRNSGQALTIYSMPGPAVLDEPIADDKVLARIAVRAYRLGKACQKRQSWCSVFDNTLQALGINEQLLTSLGESTCGPGDVVDRTQARLLPEGSLLFWSWNNRTAFAVYVRDDKARNTCKTRRLLGYDDDNENSHDQMTCVQVPGEEMVWQLLGTLLVRLPDGVRFYHPQLGVVALDDAVRRTVTHYRHYRMVGWVE